MYSVAIATFDEVLLARNTTLVRITNDDNDDDQHLRQCWRIQDCGHCVVSDHNCGWCPYSSTCVPLPTPKFPQSLLPNLLQPMINANICPLPWQERWELRTGPFGCNCSTTSLLVSAGTILATLVGLIVLAILVNLFKWVGKAWVGSGGGWTVHVREDGGRVGHIWVRRSEEGWGEWVTRCWGRMWWGKKEDDEARPLLA